MDIAFLENYNPSLLSWEELANLINVRPLMTTERVKLLDPQGRKYNWIATGWHRDPNCYPPSLIRVLLDEMVIYFTDMSRATKNLMILQVMLKTNIKDKLMHTYMFVEIQN